MTGSNLSGNARGEQLQLLGGSEVGDVEAGVVLGGQLYCELGALVASLGAANLGVMYHLRVIAIQSLGLSHITTYNLTILAMHHDGHGGCRENLFKCLATINQHIACRAAHKELDARNTMGIEF